MTELETFTFDELVDEISDRSNSFILVVEVDSKNKGFLTNNTYHKGSLSSILGLLEWGEMFWRRHVSLNFDQAENE